MAASSLSLFCSAYEEHPECIITRRRRSSNADDESANSEGSPTATAALDQDLSHRILPPPQSWFFEESTTTVTDEPLHRYFLDDADDENESCEDDNDEKDELNSSDSSSRPSSIRDLRLPTAENTEKELATVAASDERRSHYCKHNNSNNSKYESMGTEATLSNRGTIVVSKSTADTKEPLQREGRELLRPPATAVATAAQHLAFAPAVVLPTTVSSSSSSLSPHHHHYHPSSSSSSRDDVNRMLRGVGRPLAAPSWQELSQRILPAAAKEVLSSSVRRLCYTARVSYAAGRWHRTYSDYGNTAAGYFRSDGRGAPPPLGVNKDSDCNTATTTITTTAPPPVSNLEKSSLLLFHTQQEQDLVQLPPFSSLPWIDRQMVKEWRTYLPHDDGDDDDCNDDRNEDLDDGSTFEFNKINKNKSNHHEEDHDDDEELEFDRARTLVPMPVPRPVWKKTEACMECHKTFGPTLLRHHCRLCGGSFCHSHSSHTQKLPHLVGYHPDVPERVCDVCQRLLLDQNLAERIAWRLARCRDYQNRQLQPYFDIGLDSLEEVVLRITQGALAMARAIPLGAQASVAVETVDVLRKYGLNGIYTIILRQEFLAAADLLLKALGINRTAWPLSVHELSAAIFYALAQHRAMRGINPEREHLIHAVVAPGTTGSIDPSRRVPSSHESDSKLTDDISHLDDGKDETIEEAAATTVDHTVSTSLDAPSFAPVCGVLPNIELTPLIFYAPIALNFIYVEKEVDMQLLAAQQGWRLLYAYLDQADVGHNVKVHDRPASALFVHEEQKIACLAVRGTSTIRDVITDLRQIPVPFPDFENHTPTSMGNTDGPNNVDEEWTTVVRGQGLAVAGMAGAALNLYREHIDSLLLLAKQGYRIRMTGHSLGGAVSTLLGVLVYNDLLDIAGKDHFDGLVESDAPLKVYSYGTPSCVDLPLSEAVKSFVTTVVLHDDVVPRLTPTSCRGLLKHLLHIRETWVKVHFADDIRAFTDRAKTAWAPRWRPGFTLSASSSIKLKRYCRKQLQYGKKQLLLVKEKLVGDDLVTRSSGARFLDREDDYPEKVDWRPSAEQSQNVSDIDHDIITEGYEQSADESPGPRLVMDFMGGIDARSEGIIVDGEEFFEPGDHLLEGDDSSDDESETKIENFDKSIIAQSAAAMDKREARAVMFKDEAALSSLLNTKMEGNTNKSCTRKIFEDVDDDDSPGAAVVLEEIPLPRMFIPGKIVHIYAHRGVYRAAYVPRAFRELRRISMAGNMLSDHKTKSYYDALLEVSNVRRAEESPPQWTAYDDDDTW